MKILLLTYGSTGDVLPYIALGKGLADRGHNVVLCTNSRFEGLVRQHGLTYANMSDEITQLLESATGRDILEGLTDFLGFFKAFFKVMKRLGPLQTEILEDSWAAAVQHKPDTILFSPKNYAAVHFAEKLDIPAIAAPLFPQHVPTAEYPALGFPRFTSAPRYNRFSYSLVRGLSGVIGSKSIKSWRRAQGLAPSFSGIDLCHDTRGNAIPIINAYSAALIPVSKDCPVTVQTCGFWFLSQATGWSPPEALVQFLAHGPPPVYVGFGSMASSRSRQLTEIVVRALEKCGARGIIATGWGGLEAGTLPDTLFAVTDAPHDWLFPRVSAVVHHGGAGTTAAGLKAGCPTLICPFFGDQPLWGSVVHELGAGVAPIPQKKLEIDKLARAINALLNTASIKQRARALSEQINAEDGIASAITVIESQAS